MVKDSRSDEKIGDLLDSLDQRILRLRNEYEQFFVGVVKKEPIDKREDIAALIRRLGRERMNNTAQKFRYQQLRARFTAFTMYWNRTVKQLEEGTHRRDIFRVRLREQAEQKQGPDTRATRPARAAETDKRGQAAMDTVRDRDALEKVFEDFLATRKKCHERTDNVHFDRMVQFMENQTDTIKKQYRCSAVQFEVVADHGKAKLKAIPLRRR